MTYQLPDLLKNLAVNDDSTWVEIIRLQGGVYKDMGHINHRNNGDKANAIRAALAITKIEALFNAAAAVMNDPSEQNTKTLGCVLQEITELS